MVLKMNQLRRIFYEECRENLEVFERELLTLNSICDIDLDTINTIFRAIHSIKGGGATFSLYQISEFTHVMETLLDEAREGKLHLDTNIINLLLRSGDCINSMVVAYETRSDFDHNLRDELIHKLGQLIESDESTKKERVSKDNVKLNNGDWIINFRPHPDMFFSGNDPVRILRELFDLGAYCDVVCITDSLPVLSEIDPEMCYLSWLIIFDGHIEKRQIDEIFEWVEDKCDLSISRQLIEIEKKFIDKEFEVEIDSDVHPPDQSPVLMDTQVTEPAVTTPALKHVALKQQSSKKQLPKKTSSKLDAVSSIRVETDKVDNLINLVGELVITQSMLTELSQDFSERKMERLQSGLDQLLKNTKELQASVFNIRMLSISFAFDRLPRLIRNLSAQLGKSVELVIEGEQTELDKTVLEHISEPLVHLVRNAVDHGLEVPDVRARKGKPKTGKVSLTAYHQGGSILIEVRDDGAGLNKEKVWKKAIEKGLLHHSTVLNDLSDHQVANLLFAPGFSTSDQVSNVSGRGVGMDVVKRNIEGLGGHIDVDSEPDVGCVFRISLPLTLAILEGQLLKVSDQVYVVPLISIIESVLIESDRVRVVTGGVELYRFRDENIPILRLKEEFALGASGTLDGGLLCLVEAGVNRIGLLLDEMLGQQQVVIKSLESNYTKVNGFSGATILGDGSVSLILDVQGLITCFLNRVDDNSLNIAAA
ncbi:chemotaxis protein CheA [Candidatus Enterovibrio escicola]|uniref:chemotaxis protein CheA n=5 Tax=Candidatus Enterovibrio escicola TaxID=1927127 RepID=UPI001238324E|nr:chemotaxis protein CheA [Candidatus Enterovibrio escacola]